VGPQARPTTAALPPARRALLAAALRAQTAAGRVFQLPARTCRGAVAASRPAAGGWGRVSRHGRFFKGLERLCSGTSQAASTEHQATQATNHTHSATRRTRTTCIQQASMRQGSSCGGMLSTLGSDTGAGMGTLPSQLQILQAWLATNIYECELCIASMACVSSRGREAWGAM